MHQRPRSSTSIVDIDFTLKNIFGKPGFRANQRQIVTSVLNNYDILVLLPTGYGKSITFQVPAVACEHGCTVVISPLTALMKDQVDALQKRGIEAANFSALSPYQRWELVQSDLSSGHPRTRILYVSPELCQQPYFQTILNRLYHHGELNRFVIDEAHCMVRWGKTFRPSYMHLRQLRQNYSDVPITALTATATEQVRETIIDQLGMDRDKLKVFGGPFNRPNLHYEVRFYQGPSLSPTVIEDIIKFISIYNARRRSNGSNSSGSGIVYCRQKKTTEFLAAELRARGIGAHHFHASMTKQDKDHVVIQWMNNTPGFQVVVATVAFGMGIDKPDVRFVIHADLPNDVETYYQAVGRAGRDELAAACILYYSRQDSVDLQTVVCANKGNNIKGYHQLIEFCETSTQCRHLMLGRYFVCDRADTAGEWCQWACDYCKDPEDLRRRKRVLEQTEEDEGEELG
uniref:DNA 3'-5' helicase n=1 Tax=Blastobotrys adeninivorans TaxID=409370 RepID=A0A060T2X9_BLAAD